MNAFRCLPVAAVLVLAWFPALALGAETPATAPPVSGQPRKVQSHITEALLAKLPRFVPPSAGPGGSASDRDAGDSSDEILRLPKMTIRPKQVLPESDYAWLNDKGRLELALKAHPGIRVGNILGLNNGIAAGMQQEERLAAKKADLADQVQRSTLGDSEVDKRIRALTKALLQRSGTDRAFP